MHKIKRGLTVLIILVLLTGCSTMEMYQSLSSSQVKNSGMAESVLLLPDGGRLHYWDRKEGEPLILIHGLGGNAMMNWKELMLSFNADYRIIAPDLLWFGSSGSPATQKSLHTQAEAIFHLMNHLNIKQAHIVGHSYGGFVGFKMLDSQAKRIKSLTLVSSPGPVMHDKDLGELIDRFDAKNLETLFVPESSKGLKALNQGVFQKPIPAPQFIYKDVYQTFIEPNRQAQRQLVRSLPQEREMFDVSKKYQNIPMLLVWGANDKIFPLHTGINLSHHLNAPMMVISDGAHAIPAENSKALGKILESWFTFQHFTPP